MQHLISIGGGIASTILLPIEVIRKYGNDNVSMFICCLDGEHDDLWRLVVECEQITGKEVTKVAYNPSDIKKYTINLPKNQWLDIWGVFHPQHMMGSSRVDLCSRLLKRETAKRYVTDYYDPKKTLLHVGIGANEIDREIAIRRNWGELGYKVECDLIENAPPNPLDWEPELYRLGFPHNNCAGICVKAGHKLIARFLWHFPVLYAYHETQEIKFQKENNTQSTIMRDRRTINGEVVSTPLSLTKFRNRMEQRWASLLPGFDPFDSLEDTPSCSFCETMG